MNAFKCLVLLLTFFVLSSNVKGQSGDGDAKEFKWTMIGINKVHVQDFNPVDKADAVFCCGQKPAYLDKAGITLGFGMYNNLGSRMGLSLDLGATYGGLSSKDAAKSDPSKAWSQTLRADGYYHLGDPYAAIRPFGFAGMHAQRRKGGSYLSAPIGAGIRYAPNPMALVTAQVGYGIGLAGKVNNGVYISWGVYVNVNRQKKNKEDDLSFGGSGGQDGAKQTESRAGRPSTKAIGSIAPSSDSAHVNPLKDSTALNPMMGGIDKKDSIPQAGDGVKTKPAPPVPEKKDGDGDGVPDERDLCPTVPGSADNAGCPIKDKDGDGIPDEYDLCPDTPGEKARGGCPDSTLADTLTTMMKDSAVIKNGMGKEGNATVGFAPVKKDIVAPKVVTVKKETIADKPMVVQKETNPDKVTAVKKESVVTQLAPVKKDSPAPPKAEPKPELKDTDGDGVPDERDLCPNVSGSPDNAGCPIKDRDGDGVPDIVDNCPNEPGDKSRAGCPDPAVVSSYIRIPKDTVRLVIYFDVDKYSITQNSFEVLSMAVDILKRNPGATCSLFGHSDIEGDTDYNMRLSENRVKVARNYMFSYGINPDRIITAAFGKSQFVIGQQDKSLTWMNRRVEILIVKYQ